MAIDTKSKRFSMLGFGQVFIKHVIPVGSVSAAQRATFINLYNGIPLSAVVSAWTEQADQVTNWTEQTDQVTTWTEQADTPTTWSEQ